MMGVMDLQSQKVWLNFFTSKASLIEKHKKMLKQHDLFEKTSNNDFM